LLKTLKRLGDATAPLVATLLFLTAYLIAFVSPGLAMATLPVLSGLEIESGVASWLPAMMLPVWGRETITRARQMQAAVSNRHGTLFIAIALLARPFIELVYLSPHLHPPLFRMAGRNILSPTKKPIDISVIPSIIRLTNTINIIAKKAY
jgi:hypothetical protein